MEKLQKVYSPFLLWLKHQKQQKEREVKFKSRINNSRKNKMHDTWYA